MTQMTTRPPAHAPANGNGEGNGNGAIVKKLPADAMTRKAADSGTLKQLLETSKRSIAEALPKHLNADRMIKVALVAVSRSELLQQCTIGSILQCVMTGAQLGLDCSGVLGSAYMVPFWNKKVGSYEATFIPGYRGLIDLARRSGQIQSIEAHVVRQEDDFDIRFGSDPFIAHRPNYEKEPTDDAIIGAYMVCCLKDGGKQTEFMTRPEIEKIRAGSKGAWNKQGEPMGPWRDHFAEMCRKTVVRRGIKYLPLSVELAQALEAEDLAHDDRGGGEIARGAGNDLASRLSRTPSEQITVTVEPGADEPTGEGDGEGGGEPQDAPQQQQQQSTPVQQQVQGNAPKPLSYSELVARITDFAPSSLPSPDAGVPILDRFIRTTFGGAGKAKVLTAQLWNDAPDEARLAFLAELPDREWKA